MNLLALLLSALTVAVYCDDKPTSMFASETGNEKNKTLGLIDDWLALPEVFSKLDFDADSTPAAPDDIPGQLKLRGSRYWGRLYVEGFPQPIQYFRAHFGTEPPIGRKYFVFPEPRDACAPLTMPTVVDPVTQRTVSPSEIVVLAHRGTCSFGLKSINIHKTGASAFVMINNEPGLEHHPSPDTHDIELSVNSIGQPEGQLLETIWDNAVANDVAAPLTGYLIPINCAMHGTTCVPATVEEEKYVEGLSNGGFITLHSANKAAGTAPSKLEYLQAHFGVKLLHDKTVHDQFSFVMAKPAEACDELTGGHYKGKVVLVRRGGCPFVRKAEMVQSAGGIAMLVGSKHPYLVRMGVEPRWKGLGVNIPVGMISKQTYSNLFAETVASPTSTISFEESSEVTGAKWEKLEGLYNGEGWPRTAAYAAKKFDELKTEYAEWPDRLKTVEEAYARYSKKDEGGDAKSEL